MLMKKKHNYKVIIKITLNPNFKSQKSETINNMLKRYVSYKNDLLNFFDNFSDYEMIGVMTSMC